MNLRKTLIAAAIGGALGLPGAASAITVDGITFSDQAVFQTVTLWEGNSVNGGPITALGDVLSGVGRVSVIEDGAGTPTWTWGGSGTHELTVYFTNFTVASVLSLGGITQFGFTGGSVQLWSDVSGNSDPSLGLASAGTFADGNLWLDLTPETMASGFTLTATQVGTQVIGQGFLNVTAGLASFNFNTDGFNAGNTSGVLGGSSVADVQFGSLGNIGAPGNTTPWAFTGTADVQGFAVGAVPEPGTLALLGAGLLGLGVRRRKAN